jgi:hypothetical protein
MISGFDFIAADLLLSSLSCRRLSFGGAGGD